MPLTDEQNQKIVTWFTKKTAVNGHPRECAACGQITPRGFEDDLVCAPVVQGTPNISTDRAARLVMATCENCGLVQFFSAKSIGID